MPGVRRRSRTRSGHGPTRGRGRNGGPIRTRGAPARGRASHAGTAAARPRRLWPPPDAVSFDATRAAWAARDAGAIPGGSVLVVALAMADRADRATGELVAGSRGLAARLGVSQGTAWRATHALVLAGVIEPAEPARGTRPTRWRWLLAPPPLTGSPTVVDNSGQRRATDTQANGQRREIEAQRRATDTLVTRGGSETSTTRITNAACSCGLPPNHRGPCSQSLTDPADVSARVATVREALDVTRGRRVLGNEGMTTSNGTARRPPNEAGI